MPRQEHHDNLFLTRDRDIENVSLPRLEERLEGQIRALEERVDAALHDEMAASNTGFMSPARVVVWGVPFARMTLGQTLQHIDRLIRGGKPGFFITANLNYNMLTQQHPELRRINEEASFIVCDGMPMVWRSRWSATPIPERVAGSELIYALTQWAGIKGYRIFFLGGAPGVAAAAATRLQERYPGWQLVGVESPPYRALSDSENIALLGRIRASQADIVYVAFGQPKGERWIADNYREMGAPIAVQIGASFDFVAGGVPRAPRWMQRCGAEWLYRLWQEPRRLAYRYACNLVFLVRAISSEIIGCRDC